ncbi:thiamine phosphate synthase [Maribacter sp. PR1]|uniref:Thiamine-phosphate synthase n=1 Tax=Maribacter cobaltidurans TaxID=1178778 RepID=A0ABU7IYS6_9FLAO|nr:MULTISPECIES: thiamine phosphate synthase [Maribacter]MDC6390637.1 thiamine phosphate synthase [Maribacter sp. PR1]MEE1978029.1 thiamine phosphate synthase [Maribacter cobaltidurans]
MIQNRISRIHFITQNMPGKTHQQLALEACEAGVDLVQLRLKDMESSEMLDIALETQEICRCFDTTLIINDHLDIAIEVDADGVHLGNGDMDHIIARKELGSNKIIGATAYNEEEAKFHQSNGIADYIGLGTFRKTRTKPEIEDFLSLNEIGQLVTNLQKMDTPTIPLLVIGGIRLDDITPLLSVGIHGIAIASLINESENKKLTLKTIKAAFQ